jgi:hypothetical protein
VNQNLVLNSTSALKLPTAEQVRGKADSNIAEQFGHAIRWIDENVTPNVQADPTAYKVSVPLLNCDNPLRAAVLYTLVANGYAVEVELGINVGSLCDRLYVEWELADE